MLTDDATYQLELGQRLRATRDAFGMTPKQIADVLGMTAAQWAAHETGVHRLDAEVLARLVLSLNVTCDWILFGTLAGLAPPIERSLRQTAKRWIRSEPSPMLKRPKPLLPPYPR